MNSSIHTAAELRAELEKTLAALDKAISGGRICLLEKDILLERLRRIYEGVDALSFEAKAVDEIIPIPFLQPEKKEPEIHGSEPVGTQEVKMTIEEEMIVSESVVSTEESPVIEQEPFDMPFMDRSPIDKNIIESLYGDSEPCRKPEDTPKPTSNQVVPDAESSNHSESAGKVLNETFSNAHNQDIASMLSSQTLGGGGLRQKIGLNDRLMLMNDLFDNDPEVYEKTFGALESCDTIDDAYIYLYEHFTLDDNKEGVKLLVSLLETRFS